MMKKISIILALGLLSCSSMAVAAPNKSNSKSKAMTAEEIRRYNIRRFDIHNIYVWGGAGYSALMHGQNAYTDGLNYLGDATSKMLGGGGGLIGVGYEYNYKHIIFSVGPELRILSSIDRMALNNPYSISGLEYDQTKFYYLSNMREQQTLTQIMLPMLVGGQWDYLYFKAGFKLGYTMVGNYKQQMDIESTILDPAAYEEWKNIPSHYNTTPEQRLQKGKNPFGLDCTLSAEVGVNLDQLLGEGWRQDNERQDRPMRMRVALFADFGLNNMAIRSGNAFATNIAADALTTQSWQASEWGSNKLNSLLVGAKFTWMLQMNKVKPAKQLNGYLAVYTYDNVSLASLAGSTVQIKNADTNKLSKKTTNTRGLAAQRQPEGDYLISAQHQGYENVTDLSFYHGEEDDTVRVAMQKIFVPEPEPVVEDTIIPIPIVREQPIVLHNMFFANNATTILPESEASLLALYQLLSTHPDIRIRITGHTDNIGRERDNQILSEGRANSVRQNMIDRGIDPSRIEAEGKGESMPIDTNDTEEGRQNNRRVEIMIL